MPISTVIINATDVRRSADFYTTHLEAQVVESGDDRVVLDVVTARIELRATPADGPASTWVPDDQRRGFRHVGFKVDRVDPRAAALKAAGVPFHLDPLDAEGGVRICFFYDPDGTLLELVEGDLQYVEVLDADLVAAERALGVPDRPRFDHVAVTVADRGATDAFYAPLGFGFMGTIEQPHDPRGFHIGYLKSGPTVLEVFTYDAGTRGRTPQPDVPGFAAAEVAGLDGPRPDGAVALPDAPGGDRLTDPDGLVLAVTERIDA
ncbi:Catechol-2,3-dioxygenase [Microlunatus sagamiharensis]|uniref:Catechol-2,3-dioxygenase n=1 Tax=Microlunatus sagamiharensis TaxID=546874 RepID=A0A1H2MJ69_9ACTN|nr:VOC family protein [Microlunatus sagamiharensis]SDU93172.1 Catechol-2,3-dioxygenase [Microlunatus sagamiharensis]